MGRVNWTTVWTVLLIVGVCAVLYFQAVGWPFTRVPHYLPRGIGG